MEDIYFIYEYYDGPIQGLASSEYGSCFFKVQFSDVLDSFTDTVDLYLIPDHLLDVDKFKETLDYPLPQDLRDELNRLLYKLDSKQLVHKLAKAKFHRVGKGTSSQAFKVSWDAMNTQGEA